MSERSKNDSPLKTKHTIYRYARKQWTKREDLTVTEAPLTIMVNGEEFATLVCSPVQLEEMVVGFLAAEGVILQSKEIRSLTLDEERGYAYVELTKKLNISKDFFSKRYIGSCCGKSRQSFYFLNDVRTAKVSRSQLKLSAAHCLSMMETFQAQSDIFQETGGVHNAALCQQDQILNMQTDIGRHNTLDKLYGYMLMHHLSAQDKYILFSGRISSEVLLKVAKMGIGILLSKSAPTDLALRMANELNITTVGFIRGSSLNVYTHPERIVSHS